MSGEYAIKVAGLTKQYGSHCALDSLNFSIQPARVTGLLGPNGAGKTTLFSILNGLIRKNAGEVLIGGYDLDTQLHEIRQISTLVPQDLALYLPLSGEENLSFFARMLNLPPAETRARIEWAIAVCALESHIKKRAESYSGGLKRRLNLAIGLLAKPKLLYLDEPTVGVDPGAREKILTILEQLAHQEGVSIIYASHYLEEMQRLCDRLLVLNRGELVAEGEIKKVPSGKSWSGGDETDRCAF